MDKTSPQIATTKLAVLLVGQVLDEACVIVNAAKEFAQPWHQVTRAKKISNDTWDKLDDAYSNDFARNRAFYIDDDVATCSGAEGQKNSFDENKATNIANENIQPKDVAVYENAYVTLNRDYEQYSDEEECVQQDLKSLALQEVELSATNTSSVKLTTVEKIEHKDLAATSAVSPSTISRKSGIVRRCRLQGARFLSCLRGWWWRRKLPGRRKEPRLPGTVRGQCPLTPSAKQRAASLMDHRLARSPSPSRCPVWKFNTINEAMVNSAQWNEYAFEMKPNCDN
ncbi:unnamed protein product, partial [Iphiclides podalirius]